jgi:hypothetical protein
MPDPYLFGILRNEAIACSLPGVDAYQILLTSYWADYKWSREGALKGANPLFDYYSMIVSSFTGTIDSREFIVHKSGTSL